MMFVRQRAVATLPTLMRALRKEPPKPTTQPLPSLRRAFSLYDQINLIDNVPEDQLRFQGYTDTGFTVSGVQYEGSLLCVGNVLLSWGPKKLSEITADRCFEDAHHCTFLAYPWLNGNNLCLQIKKLASLGVKKASSKGITNSHVEEMPPWPLKAWLKRQGVVMGIWEVPGSIPNVKKNSYL
ncbi:hypothetical protein CK203_077730 [Vitis vinifera]|uniref:NADH dehydrogenase [ubiquinone] 1 alpha subcomplex assembly factor 3 n=1 Tax=Vitis vinifera TaxID=29760 RepID=A0A438BX87_VITVI|nr:hypothetical protein CK203_077730 [Vitis vinifera]